MCSKAQSQAVERNRRARRPVPTTTATASEIGAKPCPANTAAAAAGFDAEANRVGLLVWVPPRQDFPPVLTKRSFLLDHERPVCHRPRSRRGGWPPTRACERSLFSCQRKEIGGAICASYCKWQSRSKFLQKMNETQNSWDSNSERPHTVKCEKRSDNIGNRNP